MVKKIVIALINRYQNGGGSRHYFNLECNFEPTCSEYTKQAITKFGLASGALLGIKRMRRCADPDCITKSHDAIPEELP